jgi:hypothetical protein
MHDEEANRTNTMLCYDMLLAMKHTVFDLILEIQS